MLSSFINTTSNLPFLQDESHTDGAGITTQSHNKRIHRHLGLFVATFHKEQGTNPATEPRTDLLLWQNHFLCVKPQLPRSCVATVPSLVVFHPKVTMFCDA